MPEPAAAPALRARLLAAAAARGHQALLGPQIDTLRGWALRHGRVEPAPVGGHARQLMLVEALADHLALFGHPNPWQLADALAELFEALSLHQADLPDSAEALERRLRRGYGLDRRPLAPLSREAQMVHVLWRAWREQLEAEGRQEPAAAYLQALATAPADDGFQYALAGYMRLLPVEAAWLRPRLEAGRAWLLVQGEAAQARELAGALGLPEPAPAPPADPVGRTLAEVYDWPRAPLAERARACARAIPKSALAGRLRLLAAHDAETHAAAIDVQVRRWLHAGCRQIGVVTDDRRLARRVRALLERAGLLLQDGAGWALSTTSAAAALERWLEAVEEDCAHQPLMDVLKSPFVVTEDGREAHLAAVYRLERDIILRENIARGLARYRQQLQRRSNRLPDWARSSARAVEALLERLEAAAAPLGESLTGARLPPERHFQALEASLRTLGLWQGLAEDPAGGRVLEVLAAMRAGLSGRRIELDWGEFRAWLGRALETQTFVPDPGSGPVRLLSPAQARLQRFDALILAAVDAEHLPGRAQDSPFFNDGVRRELGLPTWEEELERRLHQFRCLLEAAPELLLTWQCERDGEPVAASPWVEALEGFHELAYGASLRETGLAALATDPAARPGPATPRPPARPAAMPRPVLPRELLPETLSAGRHQHLIDCPYRFFAADGLGLQPPDELIEALRKAEYGERVHRCLQAFHSPVSGLPGPWEGPLTPERRAPAVALLGEIARAVFARDLEDNFLHRGWLRRWLALIPAYVDWQIQRAGEWAPAQTELTVSRALSQGLGLKGRIDRIDRGPEGLALIDYKTGAAPSQEAVDSGEDVQLASYALLVDEVQRVEYVQIGPQGRVRSAAVLEGEALEGHARAVGERLARLYAEIADGAALPAWGDPGTCRYCEFAGLCRREAWSED